jgi:pseudaminic acid cytidylyltransferase
MSALAIILARGGSKRIPKKNIRDFLGEPVIHYPIRAALESKCFDEVMVSTDDPAIAAIARSVGATTPFPRSAQNSTDHSSTTDALLEVLASYLTQGKTFDFICCIYAATPLIRPHHLQQASQLLNQDPTAQAIIPVVCYSHPIQRAFGIADDKLTMLHPEHTFTRSQDLPPTYHDAGQWYWMRTDAFTQHKSIFMPNCLPFILTEMECQDIDNEIDWQLAELKAQIRDQSL